VLVVETEGEVLTDHALVDLREDAEQDAAPR
jgi:hypothetical protein